MLFSGSYDPDDVVFLLKPARIEPTPVADKERLIQSGAKHYSEMLSAERLPSPVYLRVFHDSLRLVQERFARDLLCLAQRIALDRPGDITLVSLARAGTPIGAILRRILRRRLERSAVHYSISIIRDRGIDETALRWILARHAASSVVFVDGWTGKGVIAAELAKCVAAFNEQHGVKLDGGLYVVADLSGTAKAAATCDDYLIPSSVLGATISGLVSRSVLNDTVVGPGDFHACVSYDEFRSHDLSRWFVDTVSAAAERLPIAADAPGVTAQVQARRRRECAALLHDLQSRFTIRDVNRIKPGVGEATRVLLRRVPDRLLLRDPHRAEAAHLLVLAQEKNVPIVVQPDLPLLAAALIREVAE